MTVQLQGKSDGISSLSHIHHAPFSLLPLKHYVLEFIRILDRKQFSFFPHTCLNTSTFLKATKNSKIGCKQARVKPHRSLPIIYTLIGVSNNLLTFACRYGIKESREREEKSNLDKWLYTLGWHPGGADPQPYASFNRITKNKGGMFNTLWTACLLVKLKGLS